MRIEYNQGRHTDPERPMKGIIEAVEHDDDGELVVRAYFQKGKAHRDLFQQRTDYHYPTIEFPVEIPGLRFVEVVSTETDDGVDVLARGVGPEGRYVKETPEIVSILGAALGETSLHLMNLKIPVGSGRLDLDDLTGRTKPNPRIRMI